LPETDYALLKIRRVEAIHLRLDQVQAQGAGVQDDMVIRIQTNAGIIGIGPGVSFDPETSEQIGAGGPRLNEDRTGRRRL